MKKLILTIAVAIAGVALSEPSYWATAYTKSATADKSGGKEVDAYSGYYCTAETAQALFGGSTVDFLTKYFTDNFAYGISALQTESAKYSPGAGAAGELGLSLTGYDHGQYALNSTYGDSLATFGSACLAVLLYSTATDWQFRVMSGDAEEFANGNAYFSDSDPETTSTAGDWTAVPEPTSGLLLLIGMAGLALMRKRI